MTLLGPTMVLYLVVGIGVAVAVYLSRPPGLWFRMATAVFFWPLYLPVFLAVSKSGRENTLAQQPWDGFQIRPTDGMSLAIAQVDAELEGALSSLDGWAEDVLAREKDRIRELREAWNTQAERVREMDRLLALPQYASSGNTGLPFEDRRLRIEDRESMVKTRPLQSTILDPPSSINARNRLLQSQEACQQNIERLGLVRQRVYEDLLGNLAWVRELVSMIHLAKFTGAPASRAEELVAQIAATVEGLSDLTWREEGTVSAAGNTSVPE